MYQRYKPFIEWNEEELRNALLKLTGESGIPVYPKNVMDHPIIGSTLGQWLDTMEAVVKGKGDALSELAESVSAKIQPSVLEPGPWFIMYGVFLELVSEQKAVLKKIWDKQEAEEELKKLEAEGAVMSGAEIACMRDLEEKYDVDIILVDSEADAADYFDQYRGHEYILHIILILRSVFERMRNDPDLAAGCAQAMKHPLFDSPDEENKACAKKDTLSGESYCNDEVKFIGGDGRVKVWTNKIWMKTDYSFATYEFVLSGDEYLDLYLVRKQEYCEPLYYSHDSFQNENYVFTRKDIEISCARADDITGELMPGQTLPAGICPVVCKEEDAESIWRILLDDRAADEWEYVRFNGKGDYLKTRFHMTGRGYKSGIL